MSLPEPAAVIWHDIECHGYRADLPLWRELAEREAGPVLDVGAGTGRVAVELARAGHEVVALDRDRVLLDALARRAPAVRTVVGDAEALDLDDEFGLIIVPMQTIQLLGDRGAFFAAARRRLLPDGLLAIAIADGLEPFDATAPALPLPDTGERGAWRFASQPVAMRPVGDRMRIERVRTAWAPDGRRITEPDRIDLAVLDGPLLEAEAQPHGFEPEPPVRVAPTDDYVGSTVVMLRG